MRRLRRTTPAGHGRRRSLVAISALLATVTGVGVLTTLAGDSSSASAAGGLRQPVLHATSAIKAVRLQWNKISGAAGYNVSQVSNGSAKRLFHVKADQLVAGVKHLTPGKQY